MGPLLQRVSQDVLGRIEEAANEIGVFFCARTPFIHFMDAASAPELAELTMQLVGKFYLLRREVEAAVLAAEERDRGDLNEEAAAARINIPDSSTSKHHQHQFFKQQQQQQQQQHQQKQQQQQKQHTAVDTRSWLGGDSYTPVAYSNNSEGDREAAGEETRDEAAAAAAAAASAAAHRGERGTRIEKITTSSNKQQGSNSWELPLSTQRRQLLSSSFQRQIDVDSWRGRAGDRENTRRRSLRPRFRQDNRWRVRSPAAAAGAGAAKAAAAAAGGGGLSARGALEVVDVQLQMQRQLLEISSGLACDIREYGERSNFVFAAEHLLQSLPELQRQMDLDKEWSLSFVEHAATAAAGDSRLAYRLRQTERREALGEVLRPKAKETAEFALSLIDAAEWLHALKEEGRTPRAAFSGTYTTGGGPLHTAADAAAAAAAAAGGPPSDAAAGGAAAASAASAASAATAATAAAAGGAAGAGSTHIGDSMLHYYTPQGAERSQPVQLLQGVDDTPEEEETLHDAESCSLQKPLEHLGIYLSSSLSPKDRLSSSILPPQTPVAAGLEASSSKGGSSSTGTPSSSSSSRSGRHSSSSSSSSNSRGNSSGDEQEGLEDTRRIGIDKNMPLMMQSKKNSSEVYDDPNENSLWWEAEAATLLNPNKSAAAVSLLLPHLHLALQTGKDWDCLGRGSIKENALWVFVVGLICTNSFVCEGIKTLLFGEAFFLQDMLQLARRGAAGTKKPLALLRTDAILEGRHQGCARSKPNPKPLTLNPNPKP